MDAAQGEVGEGEVTPSAPAKGTSFPLSHKASQKSLQSVGARVLRHNLFSFLVFYPEGLHPFPCTPPLRWQPVLWNPRWHLARFSRETVWGWFSRVRSRTCVRRRELCYFVAAELYLRMEHKRSVMHLCVTLPVPLNLLGFCNLL